MPHIQRKILYNKGDYKHKEKDSSIAWDDLFQGSMEIDLMWKLFADTMNKTISKNILRVQPGVSKNTTNETHKHPLNQKAKEKVKQKHSKWRKCMRTRSENQQMIHK